MSCACQLVIKENDEDDDDDDDDDEDDDMGCAPALYASGRSAPVRADLAASAKGVIIWPLTLSIDCY